MSEIDMGVRQTGRTTTMLEEVTKAAKEGLRVLVLAADHQHTAALRRTLDLELADRPIARMNIKVEPYTTVNQGRLAGDWYVKVFEDHWTVERRRQDFESQWQSQLRALMAPGGVF